MPNRDQHITPEDLVAFGDGELSLRRRTRVSEHLAACWTCRARAAEIESTIKTFMNARNQGPELPPAAGPQARLRAQLAEAATTNRPRLLAPGLIYLTLIPAAAAALFLFVFLGVREVGAAATPDAKLTPGVVRSAQKEEVCSVQLEDGFYPIPATLAYRVFEKYGIRNPQPQSYEVDYLITPALGGADDIRNLWPQPYGAGTWNAHVKDALEDHLHQLVCTGEIELARAQRDISADWIAAYKRYFQTEEPLTAHRTFQKDPPWVE